MSHLLHKLNTDPTATNLDVIAYLNERIAERDDALQTTMPLYTFWQGEQDLKLYRQAEAWWPTDAPPAVSLPPLGALCWAIVSPKDFPPVPFATTLHLYGERCTLWLQANDRYVPNPNESKEERRRRLGREATARSRALAAAAPGDPAVAAVKALHAHYIELCKQRKAAAAAWDEQVAAAKLAWEQARAALP